MYVNKNVKEDGGRNIYTKAKIYPKFFVYLTQ
jgi:hypothetical protein